MKWMIRWNVFCQMLTLTGTVCECWSAARQLIYCQVISISELQLAAVTQHTNTKYHQSFWEKGNFYIFFNDTTTAYWISNILSLFDSILENPCYILQQDMFLYALSHKQDSTYHWFCYTSCGVLVWMIFRIVIGHH